VDYDLVVIGSGAAGIGAVWTAARRRARTLLVESGEIGGECTFTGCVPSKALLAAAARGVGFERAMRSVREAVAAVAAGEDEQVLRRQGVDVAQGRAWFLSSKEVAVEGRRVSASHFVVATGSRPAIPIVEGLDAQAILTNETVFDLRRMPSSLAVLGGGPTGCEFAQAFARLGSQVTLLDVAERLLPSEEPEASGCLTRALVEDGVQVRVGRSVQKAERSWPAG
jgi:pyruvate/2-oxoglutarate dehydrogenase complex dihydrolipoamide dehydrogenase (E3) component